MAVKYIKPKGTADIMPQDSGALNKLEQQLRDIVGLYGYREIRLPTFEHTEVFARGVGDTTDIVGKEMYTFIDKGERSITLRPEGTAGVARAVLENGLLGSAPSPLKMYYLQSCFRYEKMQKGRLREFHQIGVECFGANSPTSDAEIIAVGAHILKSLCLTGISLEINSIGCKECRPSFHTALKQYFAEYKDQLCATCLDRLMRNPMRILDCKCGTCQKIAANAPVALDYLCDSCDTHFKAVKSELDALGIAYKVNPTIVRGLDYYSNTVFEFIHTGVGTQGTVCGGGRYNGLITEFEGPATPAVGFGMGIERLMLALADEGIALENSTPPSLYIASLGDNGQQMAAVLANNLRYQGVYVEYDIIGRGLKAQMKYADKLGAKYSCVIGDNEVATKKAALKNMLTGEAIDVELTATALCLAVKE